MQVIYSIMFPQAKNLCYVPTSMTISGKLIIL
uniref:Uncharacterized protein n=1 Tax=Anguilla anguilla TaxID=7936 RepID=A0A0E9WE65_ANGAN